MIHLFHTMYWIAALIIAAEGLNKLERTSPFQSGISSRERVLESLKAIAWLLLTFGAIIIVVSPGLPAFVMDAKVVNIILYKEVSTPEASCVIGFALHIVRARLMEVDQYERRTDRRLHWRQD